MPKHTSKARGQTSKRMKLIKRFGAAIQAGPVKKKKK